MNDREAATVLAEALRLLAPDHVRVGALALDERYVGDLGPRERAATASAGAVRRREFATGRALLRELIGAPLDVGVLATRAPDLPAGTCASLAHDADVAVAAVATTGPVAALGVDVERQVQFDTDEAAVVRRADEGDLDPCLAFVLKEAAYKAWSSTGGELLEFHEVRLDVTRTRFTARVRDGAASFEGRYVAAAGRWLALVVAERPGT